MLSLLRKQDDVILIGDNVRITVIRIRPGNVRLGIEAPDNIPVNRAEVFDAELTRARREKYSAVDFAI
jgi:carbon storage regulator